MASKSKTKGKSGEREASKIFEKVFGGSWQRVFGSGAFVGGANAFRRSSLSEGQIRSSKADIVPPDDFNIVLEIKSYSDFPFHQLVQNKEIPILETWLDEVYACIDDGDFWLLCQKFNRKGWYVLYPSEYKFDIKNHSVYYSSKHNKSYVYTGNLEEFLVLNKTKIETICKRET